MVLQLLQQRAFEPSSIYKKDLQQLENAWSVVLVDTQTMQNLEKSVCI